MFMQPKTQKALGVIKGIPTFVRSIPWSYGFLKEPYHLFIGSVNDIHALFPDETSPKDIPSLENYALNKFPLFARPCPKTPRHGFIESRVVNSKKELIELFKKVKEVDPDGEILVGRKYDEINYSAVYVSSGLLSIGPNNDGATGGKNSISLPVASLSPSEAALFDSGIDPKDAVYVETIFEEKKMYQYSRSCWAVQLRGGPHIKTAGANFIPEDITVMEIVEPNNNLLEWEQQAKTFKKGTVVYGKGHTLASHAAVHCILNNVAFLTSFEPKVGQTLQSTEKENKEKLKRKDFRKGFVWGVKTNAIGKTNDDFKFVVSVLHNWSTLRKTKYASWFLGVASAFLIKLGGISILTEQRHVGTINTYDVERPINRREGLDKFARNFYKHVPKLKSAVKDFYSENWVRKFGGIVWANCTLRTIRIWNEMISICNEKEEFLCQKEVSKAMSEINKSINQMHNCGWWLGKVADEVVMSIAASAPGIAALITADRFYEVIAASKNKVIDVDLKKIRTSPPCGIGKDGKFVWAFLDDMYKGTYRSMKDHKSSATVRALKIIKEGKDMVEKNNVKLSINCVKKIDRKITKYRRVYLTPVEGKGFKVPNGSIMEYKGIKKYG